MAKSLKDVLAGVKSSKTVKLDHKDMYQWNSPDGLKFVDDKHPVEKHADRVGNGDDVYNGKTKPAKYPRQTDSVYEEAEEIDEGNKQNKFKKNLVSAKIGQKRDIVSAAYDHKVRPSDYYANSRGNPDEHEKNAVNKWVRTGRHLQRQGVNKEETDGNIINQKLGAGEKKTAIVEGKYSCTMTEAGKECPEHGLKECPGYKGSKQLLTDKKMKCEGIQIGKALRVGSDYTDTHLARRKRDTNSLGKPASLLDRATKTIDKLKGSRLSLKRLTEEELDELNKVLVSYIKKAAGEMKKIANKDPMNTTFKDTDTYFKREKGVEKAKEKLNEVAPPNPKIEKWIKANKERFVKEYGPKKGKEVLYAKAWKMHSQSESGNSPATNSDYAGPGAAGWTTGRLDVGTL